MTLRNSRFTKTTTITNKHFPNNSSNSKNQQLHRHCAPKRLKQLQESLGWIWKARAPTKALQSVKTENSLYLLQALIPQDLRMWKHAYTQKSLHLEDFLLYSEQYILFEIQTVIGLMLPAKFRLLIAPQWIIQKSLKMRKYLPEI